MARSSGTTLFGIIEPFADYAFNKSHAYGYGLVAYQTAWLKAHYPVEYMAALLTSVKDNKDKTAVYLAECRSLGIDVLVPDVNRSLAEFAPDTSANSGPVTDAPPVPAAERAIVFGLASVRNVGEGLVERIVAEREANGFFTDIFDFCQRVDPVVLNKRTMESLVKAGAFDSFGYPRQGLCLVLEGIVDRTLERRREQDLGIATLFSAFEDEETDPGWGTSKVDIPDVEFDKAQRLAFEKEMLGLYVSDHPLRGFEAALTRHTDCALSDMREEDPTGDRSPVRAVGGVVTDLRRSYTKRGDLMARFVLEDLHAAMEVFVFPKTMADYGHMIENDSVLVVRGRLDTREDEPKIVLHGGLAAGAGARRAGPPHHPATRRPDGFEGRRPQGGPRAAIRGLRPFFSTSDRRFCGFPRSSTSIAATGWSASSNGCSARVPC